MEFRDHHKCLEHPVVIYAVFETINQKCDHDQHNPDIQNDNKSCTKIKIKHICSGYSYTVVSTDYTNKHG